MLKMKKMSKNFKKVIENMKTWLSGFKAKIGTDNGGKINGKSKKRKSRNG